MELVVAIGLRWLARCNYQEIEDVFGLSTTEAYRSRNKFIDALLNCDPLQIRLPTTAIEWEEVRRGFESKSLGGLINGCVGAIDGFFQRTLMLRKKDCANNQTAYFSGHYEHYGVNVKARLIPYPRALSLRETILFHGPCSDIRQFSPIQCST